MNQISGLSKPKIILAFLAMIVLGFLSAIFSGDVQSSMLLIVMSLLALFISLIPALYNRNYLAIEPPTIFAIAIFVGFYCKLIYVFYGFESNRLVYQVLMINEDIYSLLYGGLILLIGILFFIVGYQLQRSSMRLPRWVVEYQPSHTKVVVVSFVFIVIGYFFFAIFASTTSFSFNDVESLSAKRFKGSDVTPSDRLGNINYLYYRLSQIAKAPLYLLFFLMIRDKIKLLSPIGILFILSAIHIFSFSIFVSNKSDSLITALDLSLIAYLVIGRFFNFKFYLLSALAVFSMAFVASIRSGGAFNEFGAFDKIFANRYFFEITRSSHIINSVPQNIDYAYGETYIAWLNIILPENFEFSNDYFTDMGFYIARNVFGLFNSGVPPGMVPELYLNFGIAGVIIGMLIFGMLIRFFHRTLARHLNSPFVVIAYVLIMMRFSAFLINNSFNVAFLKSMGDSVLVILFMLLTAARIPKRYKRRKLR